MKFLTFSKPLKSFFKFKTVFQVSRPCGNPVLSNMYNVHTVQWNVSLSRKNLYRLIHQILNSWELEKLLMDIILHEWDQVIISPYLLRLAAPEIWHNLPELNPWQHTYVEVGRSCWFCYSLYLYCWNKLHAHYKQSMLHLFLNKLKHK